MDILLVVGFLLSWFLTWLIVVRPICQRLDRIVMRVANLDHKTQGQAIYTIEGA